MFFLVGGGFRAVQAPFWESPGVKCRFRAVFQDISGWFGLRSGETSGEMQVSCGLDTMLLCILIQCTVILFLYLQFIY